MHALDALRGALASTRPGAAIDRRFVVDAIDALMVIGLREPALALADACGSAPAIPRPRLEQIAAAGASLEEWDRALIEHLERRRTFHH